MGDLQKLTKLVIDFRNARDWKQFHKPKDIAISLSLEASEYLEHFQWKTEQEVLEHLKIHKEEISDELADVLFWVLTSAHDMKIDLSKALKSKIKKNEVKYPVKKAKGKHTKYTELGKL